MRWNEIAAMLCNWGDVSLALATVGCPGPQVCGSTLLVMLLHAQQQCPGIALQALQHFPMAF